MSIRDKAVPFPLSVILWILAVVAFLIAVPLSIPVTKIWQAIKRRQERKFATNMRAANRSLPWSEACRRVENGHGCLISDHLSIKGPVRLWWTAEDVAAITPHACFFEELPDNEESLDSEFDVWCRSRYTNAESGTALLVELCGTERSSVRQKLTEFRRLHRCVEAWSVWRLDDTPNRQMK